MPSVRDKIISEADIRPLLERAARRRGVEIEYVSPRMTVVHSGKLQEIAPKYSDPTWAAWWAFRVLHPERLADFDDDIRELFELYKQGKKKWVTYNNDKRRLLAKYLRKRHTP